jgi:hypothetical protein
MPISLSLTISKPNSSACLRWNDVVHLVDLDMAITQASLPLVWNLNVFTLIVTTFLVCLEVRKCFHSLENTCGDATRTSCRAATAWDTHNEHMSYFVRRRCLYLVHFVHLKIERTNFWGLDKSEVLWRICQGTHWELGECIENPMGTHWELEGNIVGTHWEPMINKKKSFLPPPQA